MLAAAVTISNGQLWRDTDGNVIRAHGGGFVQEGEYFYWFGENRHEGKKVSCYRSTDLKNWQFRNDVLHLDSVFKPVYYRTSPDMDPHQTRNRGYGSGAVIERPKVLYNSLTEKYVMWMHWENGKDYSDARCAVATCDTIDGDYVYHGSFNPIGHMSRDCTLFQDEDGTAYFISAARDNADLMFYRLSDDYLSIDEHVKTLWPGQYREAPALVKRGGYYFLISSACTGWLPNQGTYAYATSLTGKWSPLYDLGGPTTYDTQPTFILPVRGSERTTYLYIGDRWDPSNYSNSSYVFLPLEFPADNAAALNWHGELTIDVATGHVSGTATDSGLWRILCGGTDQYLAPKSGATEDKSTPVVSEKLSYAAEGQKWMLVETGQQTVRIKHAVSGKYLQPVEQSAAAGVPVVLADLIGHPAQEWELIALDNGWSKIRNRHSGMALSIRRGAEEPLRQTEMRPDYDPRRGWDSQVFLTTSEFISFSKLIDLNSDSQEKLPL